MMNVTDPEYHNHLIFAELDRHIAFYEALADSVFPWVSQGTGAFCNIDSYVFSSIQGTLESIRSTLRDGRINDAYALLRKYYDSIIINLYSNLYLDDHFGIENLTVEQIHDWLHGKARLPRFKVMATYVGNSPRLTALNKQLLSDDRYRCLRDRCNDHMHYNFYQHVLLNDNQIALSYRGNALDQFLADVRDVWVLHFVYLFSVCGHYMMSSDYRDYLDCGITPEPGSEHWVAPFVQEVFDQTLTQHRPDLAALIKANTSMHLT